MDDESLDRDCALCANPACSASSLARPESHHRHQHRRRRRLSR